MVDRAYKTGDASVDMKNGAKDMGHDVKNNMKDAYHEAKAGMNERKAEDAAAKREHEEAQRTGDPAAAMRAQQHEQRKDEKGEGFMESVKESIGKAGEAIKDAAVDAQGQRKAGCREHSRRPLGAHALDRQRRGRKRSYAAFVLAPGALGNERARHPPKPVASAAGFFLPVDSLLKGRAMAPSSSSSASSASRGRGKGFALVAAVYLLGLFIGALDTGIVTPARTVIQSDLGIGEQMGVWIITIYTLAYAAAIPVMGKLADRSGRKYVYLASILLFGVGSLLCGLAQDVGSFWMLLAARAVQAVGGGGIVPVATAEFGTTFPPEKRGLALGLVGGVYGIANIFGASAGSLILSVFGQANWQFIFYVNVPICAFIVVAGLFVLPNTRAEQVKPIDGWGIAVLVAMVLSLLYGLKNLDFFDLGASATSSDVWPFLLAFVVLLPVFVLIERRAADPVLNLSYFRDRDIVITLVLSVITGVILMGIIFIPQFAENVLKLPSGSGGYVVIVLAAFAGVGAPVSGKLIDRFGVKAVLAFGLAASAAGAMFLALVATQFANMATLIISLVAIGIGMGFTIGTPLNYMMLAKTKEREANSALATLSLVRSVGTAVAPAVLVAFIAHAGMAIPDRIMGVLPDAPGGQSIAQLASGQAQGGDGAGLPDDLQQLMKGSDVTTIVANVKTLAKTEIEQEAASAGMPAEAVDAAEQQYLAAIDDRAGDIESTFQSTVDEGFRGAFLLVGICSLVGLALLALYREDRPRPGQAKGEPAR